MALGAVRKNRDREQVISNRTLAILKDRLRRNGELIAAGAAFPQLAGCERVNLDTTASRTIGVSVIIAPSDLDELGVRFLIDMRATALSESVLAAAVRRKCCGITKSDV